MIDRRPAVIAQPRTVADVVVWAVHVAREHGLPLSVRGGGHNVAGLALCGGGLVIDLRLMRGVTVDPRARSAWVQGGATWAEVDAATQPHGLAAPGGVVSETGVAGLTLDGGLGWLRRKFGLSCDNVMALEVVTADGKIRRVAASEQPDLFWALRGGGGGFGVVTAFEFGLHPVGPQVMFAMVFYPASAGLDVLGLYRAAMDHATEEISSFAICGLVPATDAFPAERHGQPFVLLADFSGVLPYADVQRVFDEDDPAGRRYYWKSAYLHSLPDAALALALDFAARSPSPLSTVDLWPLGGQISRVAPDDTAYAHRGAPYLLAVEANWDETDPAAREANIAWARACVDAFRPFATGGSYPEFPQFPGGRREPGSGSTSAPRPTGADQAGP